MFFQPKRITEMIIDTSVIVSFSTPPQDCMSTSYKSTHGEPMNCESLIFCALLLQYPIVVTATMMNGSRLMISVKDNGVGFDPANRPGVRECHFGLQGISERIQQFNGTMHIDSAPGAGTKVTLSLARHLAKDEIEANT